MSRSNENLDSQSLPSPTRRNWLWLSAQVLARVFFAIWLRYRARGVERIPASGGGLLLINHQSFLDPLMAGLPLSRPVSFLARDSLFLVPVVGWILRQTYVMPINREAASTASIREAVRRLKHGFLVGVFPEGTRSQGESVGEFKPGFVALVRRANLPIYPIGISGAGDALPRRAWFLYPRRVCVVFGEPLTADDVDCYRQRGREKELIELVRNRVIACQQEADEWRLGGKNA